ncbi:hypothetical protein CEXT_187341 [Caerostris extrusa]|uniref:Uncharacterized protein n=1 Tax=Caerostris extrusa TaxID=172846 RepID=A0AAV4VSA1_CAEEX|nr:hypothetical protein CEXT_187341 [Caerostris extrusa]
MAIDSLELVKIFNDRLELLKMTNDHLGWIKIINNFDEWVKRNLGVNCIKPFADDIGQVEADSPPPDTPRFGIVCQLSFTPAGKVVYQRSHLIKFQPCLL